MRVATEEEDVLLSRISNIVNENYIMENEIMLSESAIKGFSEVRRQQTTKFITVMVTSAFLVLSSIAFFSLGVSSLSLALYLGSGGLGFFTLIFLIYATVFTFRYLAAVSKSMMWENIAVKINVVNIPMEEKVNQTVMSQNKRQIRKNEDELEEKLAAYFKLKEENDKKFEEEVASGKRRADFNFDAYNSYIEIDNDWIRFNKLRAEQNRINTKKKDIELDIEQMIAYEAKCRESIYWFIFLFVLIVGTIIALGVASTFEFEPYMLLIIRFFITLFMMIAGMVAIANLVNFIFKYPYLSKSPIACLVADKLGLTNTKKDRNDLFKKRDEIEKRIKEITEELSELKKIQEEKRDNPDMKRF